MPLSMPTVCNAFGENGSASMSDPPRNQAILIVLAETTGRPASSVYQRSLCLSLPIAADTATACRPPGWHDNGPAMDSLEDAFARWQDELLGTLYYLVGNREDARDALQETFVKCWRNRDGLGEIENLKAWIFRVALNTGATCGQRLATGGGNHWSKEAACSPRRSPTRRPRRSMPRRSGRVREALMDLRPEEQEVFLAAAERRADVRGDCRGDRHSAGDGEDADAAGDWKAAGGDGGDVT